MAREDDFPATPLRRRLLIAGLAVATAVTLILMMLERVGAPPRPALAILFPSSAVTMEALSPGVLRRIEVVEPPYIPP